MRVLLFVLLLTSPALAGVSESFRDIARETGSPTATDLDRIEARLAKMDPDWWEAPLAPCPLRGELARRRSRAEVAALFERAGREPELRAERWAILITNLSFRRDLGGILVELRAVDVLPAEGGRGLVRLAADRVVDGDQKLARLLLEDPDTSLWMAEQLADLPWPEGLHLLAAAVTDRIELPPEALAVLPDMSLDDHDWFRPVRPLGEERRAELAAVASRHPDRGVRALAARILLYAGEEGTFPVVARALRDSGSWRIDGSEWEELGKWFDEIPSADIPDRARVQVLRGIERLAPYATDDPAAAEGRAARSRKALASVEGPRFRWILVRWVVGHSHWYTVRGGLRVRPAPSWTGLIDDLVAGRKTDSPALQSLSRSLGEGARSALGREPGDRSTRTPWRRLPPPEGADTLLAARVIAGVEKNPDLLRALTDWAKGRMRELLGPGDEDWPKTRVLLTADLKERLGEMLTGDGDPWVEWLAARCLAVDASYESFCLLLRHGDRLHDVSLRSRHPLADLMYLVKTPEHLAATLAFLEREDISAEARVDVFDALLEVAPAERIAAWLEERVPSLDAELAEKLILLARDSAGLAESKALGRAAARIPVFGPRYRLLRALDR